MFETLQVEAEGAVGRLWLNRPDKLNALSILTLEEIALAARWFSEETDVRAVIVGGRGRAFSAGADLDSFPTPGRADVRHAADAGRRMADALEAMTAIAVARIHGWCVGGAVLVAAACDLRVASASARFSIPEVDLGIPLSWGGIPRLVREIGPAMTKELVITCREFDVGEARAMGFLNRVVEEDALESEALALAEMVAAKPRMPAAVTKSQVNAITAQMVGTARSAADADSLIAGLLDPECESARQQYVAAKIGSAHTGAGEHGES